MNYIYIDRNTKEIIYPEDALEYAFEAINDSTGLYLEFLDWFYDDEHYEKYEDYE